MNQRRNKKGASSSGATSISRRRLLQATAATGAGLAAGCHDKSVRSRVKSRLSTIKPVALRSAHLVDPMGVDDRAPVLTWQLQCADKRARGLAQTGCQVQVASAPQFFASDNPDLWDSGLLPSHTDMQIVYGGKPLLSRQACLWRVRIKDQSGRLSNWSQPARWTMGLLQKSDWQAQWLTDATLAKVENMPRVPIHCYRSEIADRPDAAKWIVLDLGQAKPIDGVQLDPARPAFLQSDYASFLFPPRFRIEVATLKNFSDARTVVDQTHADVPSPRPPAIPAPRFSFPQVTARYVRLAVTRLAYWDCRYWAFALGGFQVFSAGQNIARGAAVTCLDSVETSDISSRYLTTGTFSVAYQPAAPGDPWRPLDGLVSPLHWNIATPPELVVKVDGVPWGQTASRVASMRRTFSLPASVRSAALYSTARGFYEIGLNGKPVSNARLAPGFTEFDKRVLYDVHDVTHLLQPGDNAISALLGYGWYAGHMNLFDMCYIFGYVPKLLVQLEIELTNGQQVVITTDEQWKSTLNGHIRYGDLLAGECHDFRMTIPGWESAGFDDHHWTPAYSIPLDNAALTWHRTQPIIRQKSLRPVARKETSPGVYLFDFGQEFSGHCRLNVRGAAGTHITLRHAECLTPDGAIDTANLWDTLQRDDVYLAGTGREVFEPHFTWHGFRYVEVRGLPAEPVADTLIGQPVRNNLSTISEFSCSNPLFNRLMTATRWTQWNMLFDVPAGCAARAERLAWLGDIRDCVNTAMLNMDSAAFFTKYLQDTRDSQLPAGQFTDICPHAQLRGTNICAGSPGWADGALFMGWDVFHATGDITVLEKHYSAMKRWVDFVARHNPNHLWLNNRGQDWGDWLSAGTPVTPNKLAATAYFAHSTDLLARAARVLGNTAEAEQYSSLFAAIRKAFVARYVKSDGFIPGNAQGSYALALEFDLLDEPHRSGAVNHLVAAIKNNHGHLTTGFLSTRALVQCLSRFGRHDVASRMVNQVTRPSWGYMVDSIGTTFWESFNAYEKGQVVTLSLNHWPWSSIGEWLWNYVAGLSPDESVPGWRKFAIHPRPTPEVRWCRGTFQSPCGPIFIHWQAAAGHLELDVQIPIGTSAIVTLPAKHAADVRLKESAESDIFLRHFHLLPVQDGHIRFEVSSGTYSFTCKL